NDKKCPPPTRRAIEEIGLAPLARAAAEKPVMDQAADNELRAILDGSRPSTPEDRFQGWLLHLVRDAYGRGASGGDARSASGGPALGTPPGFGPSLAPLPPPTPPPPPPDT